MQAMSYVLSRVRRFATTVEEGSFTVPTDWVVRAGEPNYKPTATHRAAFDGGVIYLEPVPVHYRGCRGPVCRVWVDQNSPTGRPVVFWMRRVRDALSAVIDRTRRESIGRASFRVMLLLDPTATKLRALVEVTVPHPTYTWTRALYSYALYSPADVDVARGYLNGAPAAVLVDYLRDLADRGTLRDEHADRYPNARSLERIAEAMNAEPAAV